MKKKWLALGFAALLALSMIACGSSGSGSAAAPAASSAKPAEEKKEEAPAEEKKEEAPAAESAAEAPAESVASIKVLAGGRLSGADAESGRQDTLGVEAAAEWINNKGGIQALGGAKLEVVKVDVTSDPAQSSLAIERALEANPYTIALIGPCESASIRPMLPILEEKKIITMPSSNANQELADSGYQYFFQIAPKGAEYSKAQVGFLKDVLAVDLGKDPKDLRVGILYVNSTWGEDVAAESQALCDEAGLNVVVNESYPLGVTDVTPLVTKLQNENVDVLFPASQALDTKLIIQTMKSINYTPTIVGSGSGFLWETLHTDLGEDVNGVYSSGAWNWDSAEARECKEYWEEFVPWFEQTYGEFVHEQVGVTIVDTMLFAQALENCASTDTAAIREEILKLNADNFDWFKVIQSDGAGSRFSEKQDNPGCPATVIQWQDEKPRTIYPETAAASPVIDVATGQPYELQFDKFK